MEILPRKKKGSTPIAGPRVKRILELIGQATLLAWPKGSKGTARKWSNIDRTWLKKAGYLENLERGNIGVALGAVSDGLCTIDCDEDEFACELLRLNPQLHGTLQTRGRRGRNFWIRILGELPDSRDFKVQGAHKGEWRANGRQTIISGVHPEGQEYTFLNEARPITLQFSTIQWPDGLAPLQPRFLAPMKDRALGHSYTETQALSHPASQVIECALLADLSCRFLPKQPHQNHGQLWRLARALLDVEKDRGFLLTASELKFTFDAWYNANLHLRKTLTREAYFFEFMKARATARLPLSVEPLSHAAAKAAAGELPKAAGRFEDSAIRLLVGICWHLQRIAGPDPFFLTCRDAAKASGMDFRTANTVLCVLCTPHFGILEKVSVGTFASRRANEYRFLGEDAEPI